MSRKTGGRPWPQRHGMWAFVMVLLVLAPWRAGGQEASGALPAGEGIPLFRAAGSIAVLALATDRWEAVPTDAHDMLGPYQYLPPLATEHTQGQLFTLLEAEGGQRVADSAGIFMAVPWTIGCGCSDEGWPEPVWVEPGDTVTFVLTRTRRKVPWSGPPVYDVLGWHQPYPVGDFVAYWGAEPIRERRWLGAAEFFEFLQVLPTAASFELNPASAFEAVKSWARAKPGRFEAFPIPEILALEAG